MAGAGTFEITDGKGVTPAVPHKNMTLSCGSKIVTDVQTIVSRKASALDSVYYHIYVSCGYSE